jgi:cytolysin-activating lysine-acyltransferase
MNAMMNTSTSAMQDLPPGAPRTVAEALGQVVWVMSQSPTHRELRIKELEWAVMPAIVAE